MQTRFKYSLGLLALSAALGVQAAPLAFSLSVAQPAPRATAGKMTLSSPDFAANGVLKSAQVANGFGCQGQNISPALNWSHVPKGTQSLVLTMYDPDAPTGSGFWHWNVYNLPADSSGLPAGAGQGKGLPEGAVQLNHDGGASGYVGACPPVGDRPHRYIFTLYALREKLDLPAGASPAYLGFNLNGKVLAKAQLTGRYGR